MLSHGHGDKMGKTYLSDLRGGWPIEYLFDWIVRALARVPNEEKNAFAEELNL